MKTLNFDERFHEVWKHCQRGLVYPSPYAIFATFWLTHPMSRQQLAVLMAEMRQEINQNERLRSLNTSVVLGVSFKNWAAICEQDGLSLPAGMRFNYPEEGRPYHSKVFEASQGIFNDANGDIWVHIKSKDENACDEVLDLVVQYFEQHGLRDHFAQHAASKSTQENGHNGKVLGCRFSENLNNPSDPISIAKHTLIGGEDMAHFGGSFVMAQRFLINWSQINSMTEDQIEDLIGRKTDDTIIPDRDSRSHIKSARIQDADGNTTPVLRLGLPFGKAKLSNSGFRTPKSVTVSDEEGVYFAGFCKDATILENIMFNQVGPDEGFMNDRLFNNLKSDLGGFF